MNEMASGEQQDNGSHNARGERVWDFRKRLLVAAAYYAAVILALVLNHWLTFKIESSSVIILIALLAPFIVSRLSSFEYGGLKVELNEFKHEVRGATMELSREVSKTRDEVNSKIEELASRSRDYLQPQPLQLSDAKADQLRREVNITDEEVAVYLASPSPYERIIAYFQLQMRLDKARLSSLADCFFLEGFLASTQKETRPLWQLLVAIGNPFYPISTEIDEVAKRKVLMAMRHCLEWLELDGSVDKGGQCKNRLRQLIERFQ
jgi:hypothetical protein